MRRRTLSEFFDFEEPADADSEKLMVRNPALPDKDLHPALDVAYFPSLVPYLSHIHLLEMSRLQKERKADKLVIGLHKEIKQVWDGLKKSERILLARSLERELHYEPNIREPGFKALFKYCRLPHETFVQELKESLVTVSKCADTELITNADFISDTDLELLRKVNPPIIDGDNNYLLGNKKKAAVVAYVDVVLKEKTRNITRQQIAASLNSKIRGFNMNADGRALTSSDVTRSAAYKQYTRKFLSLID